MTAAGAQLLGENLAMLGNAGVTAILSGVEATSPVWTSVRGADCRTAGCGASRCSTKRSNGRRTR